MGQAELLELPSNMNNDQTVKSESVAVHGKLATALNADGTKYVDCFGQGSLRHDRCKELNVP